MDFYIEAYVCKYRTWERIYYNFYLFYPRTKSYVYHEDGYKEEIGLYRESNDTIYLYDRVMENTGGKHYIKEITDSTIHDMNTIPDLIIREGKDRIRVLSNRRWGLNKATYDDLRKEGIDSTYIYDLFFPDGVGERIYYRVDLKPYPIKNDKRQEKWLSE